MILINENKTRGRITMTIKRAEANNKYMNNYQPSKSFSFIIHLNFNNQYRHVLTEPIPYKVDLNELKIHMFTENDIKITIKMMKRAILQQWRLNIHGIVCKKLSSRNRAYNVRTKLKSYNLSLTY